MTDDNLNYCSLKIIDKAIRDEIMSRYVVELDSRKATESVSWAKFGEKSKSQYEWQLVLETICKQKSEELGEKVEVKVSFSFCVELKIFFYSPSSLKHSEDLLDVEGSVGGGFMGNDIEAYGFGEGTALSDGDDISLLHLEGGRAVHLVVLVAFLIAAVLGNVVDVVTADTTIVLVILCCRLDSSLRVFFADSLPLFFPFCQDLFQILRDSATITYTK